MRRTSDERRVERAGSRRRSRRSRARWRTRSRTTRARAACRGPCVSPAFVPGLRSSSPRTPSTRSRSRPAPACRSSGLWSGDHGPFTARELSAPAPEPRARHGGVGRVPPRADQRRRHRLSNGADSAARHRPAGAVWLGVLAADRACRTHSWRWLAWLVLPLAGIAVAVIFITAQSPINPLFRLRFVLSRSALQGVAITPSTRPASSPPGWVGLFRVQHVDRFGDDVHFVTVSCGVVDECGIAYIPGPPARRPGKARLTPLGGAWYHLYSVF